MCRFKMLYLSLLIGLAVNAQTIHLRGNVSNNTGKPVSKAIVSLLPKNLTDSAGNYAIIKNTVAVLQPIVPQTEKTTFFRGILELRFGNSLINFN